MSTAILCAPRHGSRVAPQQTRQVEPMLVQCWTTVYDAGPTFNQR